MDSIEIKGYKSIKSAKVDLKPINILIGANGSGKSNFISFFEFLNKLYDQKLKEFVSLSGGVERMLHKGSKTTEEISAFLTFGKNAYSFHIRKGQDSFVFTEEGLWYNSNPFYENPIKISDFGTEANVKIAGTPRAQFIRKYLNSYKKYHFHDTSKNSPFTKMSHIENDSYFLYETGDNLASFLFNIQNQNRVVYNIIVNIIKSIAPYFSDFYFQPNVEGFIRLQWQDKFSSTTYGSTDLSDGTLRFIALTTLFMQPNLPSSIIIDEPELGLHPFAITKLAGMIKSVASKGVQVIIATQSSDLVNHFSPNDIITVNQINGETTFNRLDRGDLSSWLDDYSIGELWQRNILKGGQP